MTENKELFAGSGNTARLLRDLDWTHTPLGPLQTWPQSLQSAIRIMLTSRHAMWLAWSDSLTCLYNEALSPTLGDKGDWALGASARQVWAEVWPVIGSRVNAVFDTKQGTWDEELLLLLKRSAYLEETYHTFSLSPLTDDSGAVSGVLCVTREETERVITQRRSALLQKVERALSSSSSWREIFDALAQTIADTSPDLPFLWGYLFEEDRTGAELVFTTETAPAASLAAPRLEPGKSPWPIEELLAGHASVLVENLTDRVSDLPCGPWDRPAHQAVLLALRHPQETSPVGFLIAGLNPYRQFCDQAAVFTHELITILEKKLACAVEEVEKEREALFRTLGEAVPMWLWMTDPTGNPIYQNPAWRKYTGITGAELVQSGWEALHDPADIPRLNALWARALEEGSPIEVETRMRGKDGTFRWFACQTVPVKDAQGQIIKWVGVGLDIEEKKQAQQQQEQVAAQLKIVTEATSVYIAQCDREARLKFVNRAYAERLGLTPEQCIGRTIPEIIGLPAFASFQEHFEAALQGKKVEFFAEVPYEALGSRFMHCSYVPEFDANGDVSGLVAAIADITERRRIEEALSERNREVETLNLRLQRAMTETHHRVKNNLQLISNLIDLHRGTASDTDFVSAAEFTRLSANVRALAVIHDILTHEAKAGSDQETLSTKSLLGQLIDGVRQTIGARKVITTIAEVRLAGRQATTLALVTNELISNALKHGKGAIEVSFQLEGQAATLEVCDDGPGFPSDFDPSVAANTGLELVKNIVEWDLQGRITYSNLSKGGACITVTFPIQALKVETKPL